MTGVTKELRRSQDSLDREREREFPVPFSLLFLSRCKLSRVDCARAYYGSNESVKGN